MIDLLGNQMGHVLLIVINLCCAMAWLTDAK